MRKVSAILIVLGISVITIAQPNRNQIELRKHVDRTNRFSCKHPQLRSIAIRDLLLEPSPEEDFYPPSTVLARCDEHTGCCSEGQTCTVADTTEVELVFMVNHIIDKSRIKHHEIITAQNHTRCHCVPDST